MGFITYDFVFMALVIIGVVIFLSAKKKNVQRQGILYLYKTKVGIKFIDKFSKKFEKILKPMQYVVLASGYILMISITWLLSKSVYLYFTSPLVREVFGKTPPVVPLIPYAPRIFGLESFVPPLYFTYFIIALVIVMITHEFSHGVFARINNFKIHSTGFAFLGPILGAFVEPDEKQMAKAKKFPQLVVLGAGTFANILMFLLFGGIMVLFFSSLFTPAGVKFGTYSLSPVDVGSLEIIGNSSIGNYIEIESTKVEEVDGVLMLSPGEVKERFFVNPDVLKTALEENRETIIAFDDSPAFRAQIPRGGAITRIGGEKIESYEKLNEVLSSHEPGEQVNVEISTLKPGQGTVAESKSYDITLSEREGKSFLGVGLFLPRQNGGIIGFFSGIYEKVKSPFIHYESPIGDFGWFIYYLLWWIVAINFLVALFNMLPLGILDGGRFFYLTVWGITGSEKVGKKAFKFITWAILAIILLMMIRWAVGLF